MHDTKQSPLLPGNQRAVLGAGRWIECRSSPAGANASIDATTFLEVTVDGDVIADPFAYRALSPPGGFALKFGELLSDFGLPPTPNPQQPAVADGYWILLEPLGAGAHVIRFRSSAPGFDLDVRYDLTVLGSEN